LGEYNHIHSTSNFGGPTHAPRNFPVMPSGLLVEVIAKVPSRYYRVPRYFFTVLTLAHSHGTALPHFCPHKQAQSNVFLPLNCQDLTLLSVSHGLLTSLSLSPKPANDYIFWNSSREFLPNNFCIFTPQ